MYREVVKMKYSYITPRKQHINNDPKLAEEFKKNLPELLSSMLCSKVLFFDESRFGTHSRIGHGWFKKGTRPRVKIKLGYNNFY